MQQQLHSYAIFCDDIRQETNGKTMFIGTYRDFMYFNGAGPWQLANFHIHIVYRIPNTAFFPSIQFQIKLAGPFSTRVVYQIDNPSFDSPSLALGQRMDWDIEPYRQARFTVSLAHLVVEGESRLSVHALYNGQDVMFDRLRILQTAPPPPPSSGLAGLYAPTPQR